MGICEEADTLEFCAKEFDSIVKGVVNVDNQTKSSILYVVGYVGKNYPDLLKLHSESTLAAEKNILESAIGHARTPESIEASIKFAISDQVRNCDQLYVLSEIAATSPTGLGRVWSFVKENLSFFKGKHPYTTVI